MIANERYFRYELSKLIGDVDESTIDELILTNIHIDGVVELVSKYKHIINRSKSKDLLEFCTFSSLKHQIKVLIKIYKEDSKYEDNILNSIIMSCHKSDIEILDILYDDKFLNKVSSYLQSPLYSACIKKNEKAIEYLLDKKPSLGFLDTSDMAKLKPYDPLLIDGEYKIFKKYFFNKVVLDNRDYKLANNEFLRLYKIDMFKLR